MGGEGSMMAANQSLKTNRSMLSNRERAKVSLVSSTNEQWVDPKQPTFEELMVIRMRMRKEHKIRRRKIWLLGLISLIITVLLIRYFTAYVMG